MGKLAYSSSLLTAAENKFLAEQSGRLLSLQRQTAQNVIEMGSILIEVKQVIPKGQFEDYLLQTFGSDSGYTPRSAQNFMNVARHFAGKPITDAIAPSVLYLLAAPSTPDLVRELACKLVEDGEKISVDRAKELIANGREASLMTVDVVAETVDSDLLVNKSQEFWDGVPDMDVFGLNPLPTPSFGHPSQEGISLEEVEDDREWKADNKAYVPAPIPAEPRYLLTGDLLSSLTKLRAWFDMDLCRSATYPNVPCDQSFNEVEGLDADWGGSVFLALPERHPDKWVSKLNLSQNVRVAVVLASAETDRLWFQQLMLLSSVCCFLTASPQVVFFVGTASKSFGETFSDRGVICRRAL